MDMTNEDTTPTEPTPDEEARRAKREERQGWFLLTGFFAAGGVLVAVAAIAT
jgi:hypothetical protein